MEYLEESTRKRNEELNKDLDRTIAEIKRLLDVNKKLRARSRVDLEWIMRVSRERDDLRDNVKLLEKQLRNIRKSSPAKQE